MDRLFDGWHRRSPLWVREVTLPKLKYRPRRMAAKTGEGFKPPPARLAVNRQHLTGADRLVAFTNREALLDLHGDGAQELHLDALRVTRHHEV